MLWLAIKLKKMLGSSVTRIMTTWEEKACMEFLYTVNMEGTTTVKSRSFTLHPQTRVKWKLLGNGSAQITKMKRCIQPTGVGGQPSPTYGPNSLLSQSSSFTHLHPPILTPTTLPPKNLFLQLNQQYYFLSICLFVSYLMSNVILTKIFWLLINFFCLT